MVRGSEGSTDTEEADMGKKTAGWGTPQRVGTGRTPLGKAPMMPPTIPLAMPGRVLGWMLGSEGKPVGSVGNAAASSLKARTPASVCTPPSARTAAFTTATGAGCGAVTACVVAATVGTAGGGEGGGGGATVALGA